MTPSRSRLSVWTFNKFMRRNVGALRPRFEHCSADRADRVTRMRHQEFLFSASGPWRRTCYCQQDNSGEIAGSTSYLRLIPLLPLNEFFKQSLGCIGPFFSRSSGGRFGNSGFRVFAFLHRLKLPESLKQRLRVFGRHLSRRSRRRSGNGNGNFRGITFWLRKSV